MELYIWGKVPGFMMSMMEQNNYGQIYREQLKTSGSCHVVIMKLV